MTVTEFNHGFAHTEIFIMENGEPSLVEINPRISGGRGVHNRLAQSFSIKSQTDLLIDYINSGLVAKSCFSQLNSYGNTCTYVIGRIHH